MAGDGTTSCNLTGFRAGEIRNILLWLTKGSSQAAQGPFYWEPITDVTLTYNGEIFYQTSSNEAQLWNLISDTKEAGVNIVVPPAAAAAPTQSVLTTYVDCPFAQVNVPYDKESKLVHGKPKLVACC